MNDKLNGGAAFPDPGRAQGSAQRETLTNVGMSLRDWFAGQAMAGMHAGITSNVECMEAICAVSANKGITSEAYLAQEAYLHADAMIAERSKKDVAV